MSTGFRVRGRATDLVHVHTECREGLRSEQLVRVRVTVRVRARDRARVRVRVRVGVRVGVRVRVP